MEGISFSISGTFSGAFDEVAKQMPNIERRALYHAAFYLRDNIRMSLKSAVPKATVRNKKYNDTLVDAVRFSKPDGGTINVNAMGTRQTGSGTFRTRFFENGTRERYQKSFNGVKLKKKRYLGSIKPTKFFSSAVQSSRSAVSSKMEEVIIPYIDKIFSKNI